MKMVLRLIAIGWAAYWGSQASGQTPPPPTTGGFGAGVEGGLITPPPPVLINGKRGDEVSDEELREFFQNKVRDVSMEDGSVEIIRVAPGYPATLRFREQIQEVSNGDKGLIETQIMGNMVEVSALDISGTTQLKVFTAGEKVRVFQVFVEPNFTKGDSVVTVEGVSWSGRQTQSSRELPPNRVRELLRQVANYDALVQEGGLNRRELTRVEVFRRNPRTGFTLFDIYRSRDAMVFVFGWQNDSGAALRYDESRLRIWVGNQLFVPDYVHLQRGILKPGESTSGVAILANPPFDLRQPLEVVWDGKKS